MKKALLLAVTFFLAAASLNAKGGLMAGTGKTKYIETKWFDLIYP